MWLVVIVLVVAAAVIGFYLGRVSAGGARQKAVELEAEVERQKSELNEYRREVDAHFDQTASLFVSMAGSYKALFEHLNSGYEKLAGNEGRDLFRERIASLLLDGRQDEHSRYLLEDDKAAADETTHAAPAADTASDAPEAASEAADRAATDTVAEAAAEEPMPEAAEGGAETKVEVVAASGDEVLPEAPAEQDVRGDGAGDDSEAIKAAAAAAAVSPESADGDAAAVRDESGVPVGAGAGGEAEDKREPETARS